MKRWSTHNILDIVFVIAGIVAVLGAVVGVAAVVYHWWHGILVGMEHFGVPMIVGFIIMIIVIMGTKGFGTLIFACLGAWASIVLLDIWWFWALCLYATTFAVLFVGVLLAAAATVMAFAFKVLEEMFASR